MYHRDTKWNMENFEEGIVWALEWGIHKWFRTSVFLSTICKDLASVKTAHLLFDNRGLAMMQAFMNTRTVFHGV